MSIAPAALIGSRAVPRLQDVDAHWLNYVLGTDAVASVRADPIGAGQIGETVRLTLRYRPGAEGPATLIGKFASPDPASRAMLVKHTERGDRLFLTMLDRFVSHVIDQDALGILRQSAGV